MGTVLIYILQLENDKFFIGKSSNTNFVLIDFDCNAYQWTRENKPIKIYKIISTFDDFDEDKWTIKYMAQYGIDYVRGGSYKELLLEEWQIKTIQNHIKTAQNSNNNSNSSIIMYTNHIKSLIDKYYGLYNFYLVDIENNVLYFNTILDQKIQNISTNYQILKQELVIKKNVLKCIAMKK